MFSVDDIKNSNIQSKKNLQNVPSSQKKLPKLYAYIPDKYATNGEKKNAIAEFLNACVENGIYKGSQTVQDFVEYIKIGRTLFDKEERYRNNCKQILEANRGCSSYSTHEDAKARLQIKKKIKSDALPPTEPTKKESEPENEPEPETENERIVPDCWDDEEENI
jgi:hypothetical protein